LGAGDEKGNGIVHDRDKGIKQTAASYISQDACTLADLNTFRNVWAMGDREGKSEECDD
jgi:hypothetical protein